MSAGYPLDAETPVNNKVLHRALKRSDHSISTSAAHAYIQTLHKAYCTTYEKIIRLSNDDMRELGIPIGHRAALRVAATESRDGGSAASFLTDPSSQTPTNGQPKTIEGANKAVDLANNNLWISLRGKAPQFRAFATTMYKFAVTNGFSSTTAEDVKGLSDMKGRDYLSVDLTKIPGVPNDTVTARDGVRGLHIPTTMAGNDFMKLFDPSQQMPVVVCHASARTFGLRIRVPDLEVVRDEEQGANIQDITNRICFLVKDVNEAAAPAGGVKSPHSPSTELTYSSYSDRDKPGGLVITFDACDEDPLHHFYVNEWCNGEFRGNSVDEVVAEMILAVLQLYTEGVRILRQQVDDLDDPKGVKRHTLSDADLVRAYATTAKRAAVFRRCAEATREAIEDLGEKIHWMRSHCVTINDAIDSIVASADEVAGNASASMDLTIALSDFANNHNMKLFTYVTVLLQPVAVGTGWYGMNWVNFPELPTENGYRNFALIIWSIALALLMLVARADIIEFLRSVWWRITRCCSDDDDGGNSKYSVPSLKDVRSSTDEVARED